MVDTSLQRRYRELLEDYLEHGDERQLRAVVELTHRPELILETSCGRVASSLEAVLSAYASAGVRTLAVEVNPPAISPEQSSVEVLVLRIPTCEDERLTIEIHGERPGAATPVVRLQCAGSPPVAAPVRRPIEPQQLYDVLTELLRSAGP